MKFQTFMDSSSMMALLRDYQSHWAPLLQNLKKRKMSLNESLILLALFFEKSGTSSPGQLSQALNLPKDRVSQALKSLEAQNLVQKKIASGDQRRRLVQISAGGRKLCPQLIAWFDQSEESLEKTKAPSV